MNFRTLWLLSAVLATLAVVVVFRKAEEQEPPVAPAAAPERPEVAVPVPVSADRLPAGAPAPELSEVLPAPDVSPELRALFTRLRSTFEGRGSRPNRFRLQRQLSELWGDRPPVAVLLSEASDPEAPPEYRAHFAARLRNLGKTTSPEERAALAEAMRECLARQPEGNTALARALLAFDEQPASIRVVSAPLASSPPDDTTAGLLGALALSGSTESRRVRLEHTRAMSSDPDRFPLALQTSLPPLALRPELDIEPVLQRVLTRASHFPLIEAAVQSCFFRPPGSASLAPLRVAVDRRAELDTRERERLTHRLRAGLLGWSSGNTALPPATRAAIESLLNELP